MSFYFAPTYKRCLGTEQYPIQEVTVKEQETLVEAQPQTAAVVAEVPQFHDRESLPKLNVNLNKIKADATLEILKDLDSRVNGTHKKKK